MRLIILGILMFFSSCGLSQKYQVKEALLYPNILSTEVYTISTPMYIKIVGNTILVKDSSSEYTIDKGKFLERVPMGRGRYLNAYEAKIGEQVFKLGFEYSKRGKFLDIQLKQGYKIVVFIIDYETETL